MLKILKRILATDCNSKVGLSASCSNFELPRLVQDISPEQICPKISPKDEMFTGNMDHYMAVAYSALHCIRLSMIAAGIEHPCSILDFACGYGRVLRILKIAYPHARITVCDLDREAVDFCVETFNVSSCYASWLPEQIRISDRFELIWCGSLFTHVDSDRWNGFLSLLNSLLVPGGLFVFTTQGRRAAKRIRHEKFYGLAPEQVADIVSDYEHVGFGYQHYHNSTEYGVTLSSLPWVLQQVQKLPEWRLVMCCEHAWDNHQDVVGCIRCDKAH